MTFAARFLESDHNVEAFDCGAESLNAWLRAEAHRAQRADTARTYVWTETADSADVLAYFAIAPTAVRRAELSRGMAGGFTFDIPGYLLARVALNNDLQGQGLGAQLLVDAIARIVGAAEASRGRLIVVDAIDDSAAAFYRAHDFIPVKDNPLRLVLKVATARKLMGL